MGEEENEINRNRGVDKEEEKGEGNRKRGSGEDEEKGRVKEKKEMEGGELEIEGRE